MSAITASFVFGLVNSLHCAGMCGPLAACVIGGRGGVAAYHGGRVAGYGTAGLLLGTLGTALGSTRIGAPSVWICYGLAAVLVLVAFGAAPGGAKVPGLVGLLRRPLGWSARGGPVLGGAVLGLLTPLLPCGLLYAAYGTALVAGSSVGGGLVMLGFAAGSAPLLLLAQVQLRWLTRVLGPGARVWLYRGAAVAGAAVLLWRANAGCCG